MNILDENISEEQGGLLKERGVAVQHIGYDLGRAGMQDEEIIPLLHHLRQPTFFSRDIDFYKRTLLHAHYCLVYMTIGPDDVANFVRLSLRYSTFDTAAKRMGAVVRVSHTGITLWKMYGDKEIHLDWSARR
ncbi:MAG: hypothetical protein M3014_13905 [Chloroflexota bacterium]|nr:hypothetical protein [Chloroflexota bacterium]